MNKKLIILASIIGLPFISNAQLSKGGFPWSMTQQIDINAVQPLLHELPLPDWNAFQEMQDQEASFNKPNYVSLFSASNIKFPEDGSFKFLNNGDKIWIAKVKIAGAKGLGLYFDNFNLPKGVSMYVSNANGKHVLGAYDASNNNNYNNFVTEAVQGEVANIELNIPSFVNENEIALNINNVAVYFEGIANLARFTDAYDGGVLINAIDTQYYGRSSSCNINAICPLGEKYHLQKDAALQQLIPSRWGAFSCSGTMVNRIDNTPSDCKQYYLTAGHCEGSNSLNSSTFSQILLRYQYESSTCANNAIPESKTMVGAKFVARSYVNSGNPSGIIGDFLLLELNDKIPESWNVNLAGWNRETTIPRNVTQPKQFSNFSHPSGDTKKIAATQNITSVSNGAPNSHWFITYDDNKGIIEGGSSGSGLFNEEGYLIGIASTAGANQMDAACNVTHRGGATGNGGRGAYNYIYYAQFSNSWDYSIDGNSDNRKLKPWLDPNGTNATKAPIVTSSCTPIYDENVSVKEGTNIDLGAYINIYPQPVTNGTLYVQFNFTENKTVQMNIIDINGRTVKTFVAESVRDNRTALDVSSLNSGFYMLNILSDGQVHTQKIVIN